MPTDNPDVARTREGRRDLAVAAVIVAGAAWWLNRITPVPWPDHNPTRDLLLVRDCLELGRCQTSGPFSSVGHVLQGAVWLHILTSALLLGGGTIAARDVVIALSSLGVGTVFLVGWRWVNRESALPGALAALAIISLDAGQTPLVNPSTVFFSATVCSAALLVFALTGRYLALAVAAVFVSHAANSHTAAYSLLPGLCLVAGLGARRPWHGLLIAIGAFVLTSLVTSFDAIVWDVTLPEDPQWRWVAPTGLVLIAVVAQAGAAYFARLGASGRVAVVAASLLSTFVIGSAWLLGSHHELTEKYVLPIAGSLGLTVSAGTVAALRRVIGERVRLRWMRWAVPLAGSMAALLMVPIPSHGREWSYPEAAAVADALARRGWSYATLEHRVQGTRCGVSFFGMMPFLPRESAPGTRIEASQQARLWLGDPNRLPALPPGAEMVHINGSTSAIVSEIDSWLVTSQVEACRTTLAPGFEPDCEMSPRSADDVRPFRFSNRSHHVIPAPLYRHDLPSKVRFSIALRSGQRSDTLTSRVAHELTVMPQEPGLPAACQWHITDVEGLEADGRLPSDHVRVTSVRGGSGRLVLERIFGAEGCPMEAVDDGDFPCFIESAPGDPPWVAAMRVERP